MDRNIETELLIWKNQTTPTPLLLRGARQVGKTYVVEKLGANHFKNFVSINFEQRPELRRYFDTLDPKKICANLELVLNTTIQPQKTLVFFDEIQECPQAIMALRYFKEQMPTLHVIGAGSLLEFTLNDESFRMPVGRVQFLYLRPFSFSEFLIAAGYSKLRKHLKDITLEHSIDLAIHEQLLKLVKEYFSLGGMPAVLSEYFTTGSLQQCQIIQFGLLQGFRNDFGKYAKSTQHKYLQLLFEKSPGLISQWFKYSKVDPNVQPRDIKVALEKLSNAGLINLVHATAASGLPLNTTLNLKKFKLLFLDIGLAKRAFNVDLDLQFEQDIMLLNQGILAEQFVGQELLAYMSPHELGQLFFWQREQRGSEAQVDFMTTFGAHITPVEVKSGTLGKLKSLKIFMEAHPATIGVRISSAPLSFKNNILSIPFYLISELKRLTTALF